MATAEQADQKSARPAVTGTVATLGPAGTDAHAEAVRLGADVQLLPSFPAAMQHAVESSCMALVAAGYLDLHEKRYGAWVDLHFLFRDRLRLKALWESRTKEMCVAVRAGTCTELNEVTSLALHPSTRSLVADLGLREVDLTYVRAKPHAVRALADGEVDACLGSVDVVAREEGLAVLTRFQPSMVWCLYEPVTDGSSASNGALS